MRPRYTVAVQKEEHNQYWYSAKTIKAIVGQ